MCDGGQHNICASCPHVLAMKYCSAIGCNSRCMRMLDAGIMHASVPWMRHMWAMRSKGVRCINSSYMMRGLFVWL